MADIELLDPSLANMIAAGEVVDRPASVVKELVENSVDAGATTITVEVAQGNYIRISDNGCGIPASQLERAFLRHATSKLQVKEQLSGIATLGFRGEALAAISAVSRLEVTSCTAEQDFAQFLRLEGGVVVDKGETAGTQGTILEVRDIFFNTPARQKFMKSPRSENSAILAVMQEMTLSHPEISMRFIREGKEELHSVGDGNLESVLWVVLGKTIASGLRSVALSDLGRSVTGYVSLPSCCRPSRTYQHFFVNGRYVKSPMLCQAVENAYKNQKMVGRFPSAVLHLELDVQELDVNVHPAKTTVKFAYERDVFTLVYQTVKKGLEGYTDIQQISLGGSSSVEALPEQGETLASQTEVSQAESSQAEVSQETPSTSPMEEAPEPPSPTKESTVLHSPVFQESFGGASKQDIPKVDREFLRIRFQEEEEEDEEDEDCSYVLDKVLPWERPEYLAASDTGSSSEIAPSSSELASSEITTSELATSNLASSEIASSEVETSLTLGEERALELPKDEYEDIPLENMGDLPSWRVVGEFFHSYIAVEVGEEIYLIDKHAAHERMNFERLKSQNYQPMAQSLMKPVVVTLSAEEMSTLLEHLSLFREFSFDIEEFSRNSVIVREAPYDLDPELVPETLTKLISDIHLGDMPKPEDARDHLLHSIACQSAIKAGYHTQELEQNLLAQIVMEEKVKHCPHGRPIVASLSKKELEKRFKRIL